MTSGSAAGNVSAPCFPKTLDSSRDTHPMQYVYIRCAALLDSAAGAFLKTFSLFRCTKEYAQTKRTDIKLQYIF